MKESLPKIYIDWACCKVEQDLPDQQLCDEIVERLKDMPGV